MDKAFEYRSLAFKLIRAVIFGEGNVYLKGFVNALSRDLFLKAGDKLSAA